MNNTVLGKNLPNGLFSPNTVPNVWENLDKKIFKKIYLISLNRTKIYSYFLPRDQRNTKRFVDEGFVFTSNIKDASIFVATSEKTLYRFLSVMGKYISKTTPILLHVHEPYGSGNTKNIIHIHGKTVHVMNCFTYDVWVSNTHYFPINEKIRTNEGIITPLNFLTLTVPKTLNRTIAMVASYAFPKNTMKGAGGLSSYRTWLALQGHKIGVVHIYGRGWPRGVSRGSSYESGREGKIKLLKPYQFCICFENTHSKYYVTEKIWEAILGGCLPIYMGSSWIYEVFPENSFIDYAKYNTPANLFATVLHMSQKEWESRMETCINVYNQYRDKVVYKFDSLYDRLFAKLNDLCSESYSLNVESGYVGKNLKLGEKVVFEKSQPEKGVKELIKEKSVLSSSYVLKPQKVLGVSKTMMNEVNTIPKIEKDKVHIDAFNFSDFMEYEIDILHDINVTDIDHVMNTVEPNNSLSPKPLLEDTIEDLICHKKIETEFDIPILKKKTDILANIPENPADYEPDHFSKNDLPLEEENIAKCKYVRKQSLVSKVGNQLKRLPVVNKSEH